MSYKIGSFNMHNLGFSSLSSNNPRDLKTIARIIKDEKFDIVGLQEVLSEGKAFIAPSNFKNNIIMELGGPNEWGFEWADAGNKDFEFSSSDPRGEGYAFVWNKKRIKLCETKYIRHDGQIIKADFKPRMLSINKEFMFRKPYYGRFMPRNGPNVEIRLICVHTYFGANDNEADRLIRQRELDILLKEIYPQIADKRYGDPMSAYTFVLGDYNAELITEESIKWQEERRKTLIKKPAVMKMDDMHGNVISLKYGGRVIHTVQDQLTTLKAKFDDDTEFEGNGYYSNYDHFSYDERTYKKDITVKCERLRKAVSEYCAVGDNDLYKSDFEKYHKTISDHIPIFMEIDFI